jgi:hypothetical protein
MASSPKPNPIQPKRTEPNSRIPNPTAEEERLLSSPLLSSPFLGPDKSNSQTPSWPPSPVPAHYSFVRLSTLREIINNRDNIYLKVVEDGWMYIRLK